MFLAFKKRDKCYIFTLLTKSQDFLTKINTDQYNLWINIQ